MNKAVDDFGMDRITLCLLAFLAAGMPALAWAHAAGILSFWPAFLLATLLMNFSFTVWHETSHANFARTAAWNHAAGILSSVLSVYPGYFARRREHLAHHKWEGDPELDPVYPRIQGSAAAFFVRLSWLTLRRAGTIDPAFLPLSEAQKNADRLALGLFAFLVGLSIRYGFFTSLCAVFLLPRLAIFYLHAFYICYLPHAKSGGGFEKYRVAKASRIWWRAFTAGQWAHGVHHRWPNIPWHKYAENVSRLGREENV